MHVLLLIIWPTIARKHWFHHYQTFAVVSAEIFTVWSHLQSISQPAERHKRIDNRHPCISPRFVM